MKNLKILIVEDEELVADILADYLEASLDVEIQIVLNGLEAMQETQNERYHLLIVDYYMPVMDGVEFLKNLRKQNSNACQNTPAIVLSSYVDEAKTKLKESTNVYFLEKSLFKAELFPLIDKVINEGNI